MHNKLCSIIMLKRGRSVALYMIFARVGMDNDVVDLDLHDLQRAWMVEDIKVEVVDVDMGSPTNYPSR